MCYGPPSGRACGAWPEKATAEAECVRQWRNRLDRLDQALTAERDLSELARRCRSASPRVPDVAEAVFRTVLADLQEVQLQLIKLAESAARRSSAPVRAGSPMSAITPTLVTVRG